VILSLSPSFVSLCWSLCIIHAYLLIRNYSLPLLSCSLFPFCFALDFPHLFPFSPLITFANSSRSFPCLFVRFFVTSDERLHRFTIGQPAWSCPVLSCPVLSCLVLSGPVVVPSGRPSFASTVHLS